MVHWIFRTLLVFFLLISFSCPLFFFHYYRPSYPLLFFTDTHIVMGWSGVRVWSSPTPDPPNQIGIILTLLSTLQPSFWTWTLEQVKEIWEEGTVLSGTWVPVLRGVFLCVFGYMHAQNMFIKHSTNSWLTDPPFLSWDWGLSLWLFHHEDLDKVQGWIILMTNKKSNLCCSLSFLGLSRMSHLKF